MAYTATYERTLPATWTREQIEQKLTEVEHDGLPDDNNKNISVDLIRLRAGKMLDTQQTANLAEFGTPGEFKNEAIKILTDIPVPGAGNAGEDPLVGFFSKLQKRGYSLICYSNLYLGGSTEVEAVTCRMNPDNAAPNEADVQPVPGGGDKISKKALELIAESEGFDQPGAWPGAASGVTIGVGYDLGYNTAGRFKEDWQKYLGDALVNRLSSAIGLKGSAAQAKSHEFGGIKIPHDPAVTVFRESTVPRFLKMTLDAFPKSDQLPPDALGALVSIVFNRGPAVEGPRRREMMEIKKIIQAGGNMRTMLDRIAAQIISMKRLWQGQGLRGLLVRRDAEAALVKNAA